MDDTPPANLLLQVVRQKPKSSSEQNDREEYAAKSDIQPGTSGDIQPATRNTQPDSKRNIQPATRNTQPDSKRNIQSATRNTQQDTQSDILYVTKSNTLSDTKSSVQTVTSGNIPHTFVGLSKGQARVLQYLSSLRNPAQLSQTVPVGYDAITNACDLSRSGSRKVIGELLKKGLLTRLKTLRGEQQGSIYCLMSNTLYVTQSDTINSQESNTLHVTLSDTSSSKDLREQLLEDIFLEGAFHGLNPISLLPYLNQFSTSAELQDFLDMVNACIEASQRGTGSKIQNPHGFLFGQLRSGFVNPPPGYKSRKVRSQERRNQQLEEELATLQALKQREQELKFEIFKAQLSEEHWARIEEDALSRVEPGPAFTRNRQVATAKEEILQEWFAKHETPPSISSAEGLTSNVQVITQQPIRKDQ